jgi:hypothetical protein
MASGRLRTDVGTAALHGAVLGAFCVLLGTGLRIAADDPDTMWLSLLDPILPVEQLWYRHLVAAVVLMAGLGGYAIYVPVARLGARLRFDRARLATIWRRGKGRFSALNVAVVWVLIGSLIVEIGSGAMVFWGAGQGAVILHRWAAWLCVACIIPHVSLHASYGGTQQVLRIFKPSRLRMGEPPPDLAELLAEQLRHRTATSSADGSQRDIDHHEAKSVHAHPLATALMISLLIAGLAWGSETLTRPVLVIAAISKADAPRIDGDLSDPIWAKATAVSVMTTQGGDFGGTHQSRVEIRGVHDDEFTYFAFVWEDPTRSLKHHPLVKHQDGWQVAASRADLVDENVYNEDKFAVLLSPGGFPLLGAAIHLSKFPLAGKPASSSGRGLHYTTDGSVLDVWEWRASHGGPGGHIDNCHIGEPREKLDEGEILQYEGGFAIDPGPLGYESNFTISDWAGKPHVQPRRLPKSLAATERAIGRISDATNESESENARWWMTLSESIPYNPTDDANLSVGTVIPGIIVPDIFASGPDDVLGFGRWAAGRWTLELVRRLKTSSPYDVEIKTGTLMWVAAFDHSEKRHTRHLRPIRLELQ